MIKHGVWGVIVSISVGGTWSRAVDPPASAPTDAAALYVQADRLVTADCPASSNLEYGGHPPYPPAWYQLAKDAFEKNVQARALARKAGELRAADWSNLADDLSPLNHCRDIANQLGDAALYVDFLGDHAEAFKYLIDVTRLAEHLEENPGADMVRSLVAVGIRALMLNRLEIIASDLHSAVDANDKQNVQLAVIRQWIDQLLATDSSKQLAESVLKQTTFSPGVDPKPTIDRFKETFNRVNAERGMAAMILACHLFKAENARWPNDLGELTPKFLPKVPTDPWGDGKQTLGYALIDGGLPDESDRPLVYCRCESDGALYFRLDEPEYSFYTNDGTGKNHGGQFRDVARWIPLPLPPGKPTVQAFK